MNACQRIGAEPYSTYSTLLFIASFVLLRIPLKYTYISPPSFGTIACYGRWQVVRKDKKTVTVQKKSP